MWRTPDGDRALTPGEWALFREGLVLLWDRVRDEPDEPTPSGVRVFDALQPGQKLGLLAEVGQALSDPDTPPPRHTAANEAAVAAVFATLREYLEVELDDPVRADGPDYPSLRALILGAVGDAGVREGRLPAAGSRNQRKWTDLLEELEHRLFWDADYAMADEFLDLPPDEARRRMGLLTIDREYYRAVPPDPDDEGLVPVRQALARLAGRPAPDDSGTYPALLDRYHGLTVGPCEPDQLARWRDHPWVEEVGLAEPEFDCTVPVWAAHLAPAVPAEPFAFRPDPEPAAAPDSAARPAPVLVGPHGGGWAVRDDEGMYWCDVVGNGWTDEPDDEFLPALVFATQAEARRAWAQAEALYAEGARRHDAARELLGRLRPNG